MRNRDRSELNDLLRGEGVHARGSAPEPLLLPRIARVIDVKYLDNLCFAVSELSTFRSGPWRWPLLADATLEAIDARGLPDDVAEPLRARLVGAGAGRRDLRGLAARLRDGDEPDSDESARIVVLDDLARAGPSRGLTIAASVFPVWPIDRRDDLLPRVFERVTKARAWLVAVAVSRIAPFLDQQSVSDLEAKLLAVEWRWPGATPLDGLTLPSASPFHEINRALAFDGLFADFLASDPDQDLLNAVTRDVFAVYSIRGRSKSDGRSGGGKDLYIYGSTIPDFRFGGSVGSTQGDVDDDMDADWDVKPSSSPAEADSADNDLVPSEPMAKPPQSAHDHDGGGTPARRAHVRITADLGFGPQELRQAFCTDMTHDVRIWIGPPTDDGIPATSDFRTPEPTEAERVLGALDLVVTLIHDGNREEQLMRLPLDDTQRGGVAKFELRATTEPVVAEVWIQHQNALMQYLELEGLVANDPPVGRVMFETTRIQLFAKAVIRALPESGQGSMEFGSAVVQSRGRLVVFGPRGTGEGVLSLQGARPLIDEINERLFKATKVQVRRSESTRGTAWSDNPDEEVRELFRFLARWGSKLYDELALQDADLPDPIQFVNLDPADPVPLEYVYDRSFPVSDSAPVCSSWAGVALGDDPQQAAKARQEHRCTDADGQPLEQKNVICPLGFWSLSRIIERHERERAKPRHNTTEVLARAEHKLLPPMDSAVFGAAPRVNDLDIASVTALLDRRLPYRHNIAETWDEWRSAIADRPSLLILLPHHGEHPTDNYDFLEIGPPGVNPVQQDHQIPKITDLEVTPDINGHGPIVLLLGCKTAGDALLPSQTFARQFQASHASIVVATLASVLGQHAAPFAMEFIDELIEASHETKAFGAVMRDVRLKMFKRGFLMALVLVAFGDADWTTTPVTTDRDEGNDVPH